MPSLLLVIFVIQLLTHIVNTVGATAIENLLWTIYTSLPPPFRTPTAPLLHSTTRLRPEILRLKRELAATSSQDQFARWAKLRRQHDRLVAEHDDRAARLQSHRTLFARAVATARFLGLAGLRFVLQFWFAKAPVFWVPRGWVPWYAEVLLAFPRAPRGAVSVQVWWAACAAVVLLGGQGVETVWGLVKGGKEGLSGGEREKEGMKMEGTGEGEGKGKGKGKGEKEL